MDSLMDFVIEKLIPILLIMLIVTAIVGLPWALYQCYAESKKDTFSLKKEEWVCTNLKPVVECHGAPFRRCEAYTQCTQYTEKR